MMNGQLASYLVAHIFSDKVMGWELGSNVLKYFTFGFVWQEQYFQKFSCYVQW